jgi:hypothetical protein
MQPYAAPGVPVWSSQQALAGAPPTVLGVQLQPGERVIYVHEPSYTVDKVVFWVLGLLTLIVIVGLVFILLAVFHEKWNPRAQIVTTQRVIEINGKGEPSFFPLYEIADLTAERANTGGGGGLIGMAVMAVMNSLANNKPKLEAAYWKRAQAIVFVGKSGARFKIKTREPIVLGPFVAHCVLHPGSAEAAPSVPYQP